MEDEKGAEQWPNAIEIRADENDWSNIATSVWEALLNHDSVNVLCMDVDTAVTFAQVFLKTMGYTSERAALETQKAFKLNENVEPTPLQVHPAESLGFHFVRFKKIVETLRKECPWDKEVTPYQLVTLSREELSELMDAINNNDMENYAEELGDLWLHLFLHSTIAEETNAFNLETVFQMASEKAISRHPHVFASDTDSDAATVLSKWQSRKGKKKDESSIPPNIFTWALRLQDEAHHNGLDWENAMQLSDKLSEEFEELRQAYEENNHDGETEEVGDLLFTVINIARLLDVDPEDALLKTSRKFQKRLDYVTQHKENKNVDELWEQSKHEIG